MSASASFFSFFFFFFLDIPPQCCSFVPSNCVRPSGAGDFAHNTTTTKMRRRGEEEGCGGWERARGGQCVWMRLNSHHGNNTHAPFPPTGTRQGRGRQEGRHSVRSPPSRGESPRMQLRLTPKLPEPLTRKYTDATTDRRLFYLFIFFPVFLSRNFRELSLQRKMQT